MANKAISKYNLLVFSLFFLVLTAHSQSFTTRLYTTADGLSDNFIFCIYQDSYGYLWTGTPNGLSRFDGNHFLNFGLKNGLPSLYVDNVYEDHSHRLWIGTRSGIAEMKGDSCYSYPVNDKEDISFVSGFLEPDPGIVWATTNKGVYEFKNNSWVKVSLYPGSDNISVGKIIKTSQGLFINYNNNQLIQRRPDGSYHVLLAIQTNHPYYNSLFEKSDTIYISTYSGLQYWDKDKWVSRFEDTLQKKYIYTSYLDNSNRFWFGTKQDGVLVAMPGRNKATYFHIPLSFNLVSRIIEDRDKNIWIAGFRGLLKISPSPYSIVSLPEFDKMGSIRNCIIMPSGKMIISGENGKLLIVKTEPSPDSPIRLIAIRQLASSNDFIDYYTMDEKQRVWFTTRTGELYRLDDMTLVRLTSIVAPKNDGLRDLVFNKKKKQFYVCGDSVLLTGNENHLDTFFSSDKKTIPIPLKILVEESDGSMLVQTVENGLYLITSTGELYPLNKKFNLSLSINDKTTKENIIWAAYAGRGISKYAWKNKEETSADGGHH